MPKRSPADLSSGVIRTDELYTLKEVKHRLGLTDAAYRAFSRPWVARSAAGEAEVFRLPSRDRLVREARQSAGNGAGGLKPNPE